MPKTLPLLQKSAAEASTSMDFQDAGTRAMPDQQAPGTLARGHRQPPW